MRCALTTTFTRSSDIRSPTMPTEDDYLLFKKVLKLSYKISTVAIMAGCLAAWWSWIRCSRRWHNDVSLIGKTIVVTGGNTGIGRETVRELAIRGARVVIACRDVNKGEEAAAEIITDIQNDHQFQAYIAVKKLDLASFASVRQCAEELLQEEEAIHILINNAGVAACPRWETEDGFEMQFGVNHLGHFLFTLILLDRLKQSAPARIINVSSIAHYVGKMHFEDINMEKNYQPLKAYQQSKLANVLFTKELAKRLEGTGVATYCLHPGVIHSGLNRHLSVSVGRFTGWLYSIVSRIFFKSVKQGARTTIYCATDESLTNESGCYYSGGRRVTPSARARDDEAAKRLWNLSEKFTGITLEN